MFSQVSYNVVVERFKAFASGHYLIKRFSHGQIDVTDIMKDAEYPWMHIVPVSMNPSTGTRSFSFDIIFADLPRDKEDKTEYQRESLSDCMRLAEDLLAEIQNGNIIFGEDVELEQGTTISPFMEEYTHVLTGVTLSLTMTFPWDWNACEIPADWSAGGTGSGGTGGGVPSLILKTNGTPNIIQNILDLVDGTGMDIIDLGDGRVQFTSTGGGQSVALVWDDNHLSSTGNQYKIGDVVYYLGSIYRCIADNDSVLPTSTLYWTLLGTGYPLRQSPSDWNATDGDNQILNKPTIPTLTSELTNDSGFITSGDIPPIPKNLDDLEDVKVPSPNDGEVLTYDTGTGFWVSAPAPTEQQGFQDVLIEDSTLTQANLIDASGFNFEIQNVYDFNVTGSYRGVIKSTIPSSDTTQGMEYGADFVKIESQNDTTSDYGQIQVTSQGVGISTQSGADLTAINMSSTQIGIRTPNVVDGVASVGQVLTLQNASTGDVEYTSVAIGDMTKAVYDTDVDGVVDSAERIQIVVRNSTGVTLTKGQVVYLSGATGNRPNAVLADASTEATSSKTIGLVIANIANNSNGQIAVNGTLHDLDTSAFNAGDTLWLSETAGAYQANTPPAEPAHSVFIGYVARSHPNLGRIVLAIQNGYELNELHGVDVPSPASNDYLYYDGGTSLWKSRQLALGSITDVTTIGYNLGTLPNPSAISYLRINADNSVSALTLAQLKSDLGLNRVVLTSDVSTSAISTALVDVTGLSFPIVAGNTYKFTAYLIHTVSVANVGLRWAINADVAVSNITYRTLQNGGVVSTFYIHHANTLNSASTNTGATQSNHISTIEGILVANNNGNAIVRFSKALANSGTLTTKANSFIEYQII